MSIYPQQLPLNFESANPPRSISGLNFRERLVALLTQDLDFHGQDSSYASHNFHSFPAKFPPQLPRRFIAHLTEPDDIVLDPMAGSGTTVLEAFLAGRFGIGCDIDPLALMLSRVKTMPLSEIHVIQEGNRILSQASFAVRQQNTHPVDMLNTHWDAKTRQFIDYWFAPQTQRELQALITAIRGVVDPDLRLFFELVFSSIIITKTGGVSLALDLAHTRPHRAKIVIDETTHSIAEKSLDEPSQRAPYVTKTLRSPLEEFEKRFHRNAKNLQTLVSGKIPPGMAFGDAQKFPCIGRGGDVAPHGADKVNDFFNEDDIRLRRFSRGEVHAVFESYPDHGSTHTDSQGEKGKVVHMMMDEPPRFFRRECGAKHEKSGRPCRKGTGEAQGEIVVERSRQEIVLDKVRNILHHAAFEDFEFRNNSFFSHSPSPVPDVGEGVDVDLLAEVGRAHVQ